MRRFEDQRGQQCLAGRREPAPLQASQASCLLFSDNHRAGARRRIDGERMRMITVQEARAAMGFPVDYALPENQRTAMHMLGNAVCPPVARDVIAAILEAA